jgi:hypothetical protein
MDSRPRFDSRKGGMMGFFRFAIEFRPALGPTHPPIERVSGVISPGIKWPGREADHSPPFCVEVKNAWIYISTPPYVFMS